MMFLKSEKQFSRIYATLFDNTGYAHIRPKKWEISLHKFLLNRPIRLSSYS